jgi:hypothetical protein
MWCKWCLAACTTSAYDPVVLANEHAASKSGVCNIRYKLIPVTFHLVVSVFEERETIPYLRHSGADTSLPRSGFITKEVQEGFVVVKVQLLCFGFPC